MRISSTSYWWARLFGVIGRTVARCLLQHAFYQFVYVDDLRADFYGHRKFHNFLVWLLLHEMIGTPFAYHKFRGGTVVSFIGYELDHGSRLLGMSEARGEWLRGWVREAKSSHWVVSVRKFREYLGRLGFVCRVVYWIKPHLAPLYAWAAASKSMVAKLPDLVILTLLYLEKTLGALDFKVAAAKEPSVPSPVLHTDARWLRVLGGWDSRFEPHKAPWFSIRLDPSLAPYLFDGDGRSQWASTSAELLATLVGLWAFGHLKPCQVPHQVPVELPAATDNKSNQHLMKKQSTTKWPLMLVNMQFSHLLREACLRVALLYWARPVGLL